MRMNPPVMAALIGDGDSVCRAARWYGSPQRGDPLEGVRRRDPFHLGPAGPGAMSDRGAPAPIRGTWHWAAPVAGAMLTAASEGGAAVDTGFLLLVSLVLAIVLVRAVPWVRRGRHGR